MVLNIEAVYNLKSLSTTTTTTIIIFLCSYYVPGTVLRALHMLTHLNLTTTL